MKEISTYISEKLKLSGVKFLYHPETKDELKQICLEILKKNKNANLNVIDTSKITDMSYLFSSSDFHNRVRNIDISRWDTSKVEKFEWMFAGCNEMDTDVSNFNFASSNGKYVKMFAGCLRFKGKGLETWDDMNIIDADAMFLNCRMMNFDFSHWDMSKAENIKAMFEQCWKFNNGGNMKGLNNWDVDKLTADMMRNIFLNDDLIKEKDLPKWYKE